jgi:hypothetical protein
MHSAWLASGNIRSPVRSEGTTEDTTLAGEGDSLLCALQPTHPQRPVTRARDGARALDDQLLLHLCKARHDMKENRPTGVFVSMLSVRVLKWKCWLFISLTRSSNPSTLRPRRSTHALDYIEIYKRLASDSDDTAGEKVSVFCRAA